MCALVGIEGIVFTVITTESEISKIVGIISPSIRECSSYYLYRRLGWRFFFFFLVRGRGLL